MTDETNTTAPEALSTDAALLHLWEVGAGGECEHGRGCDAPCPVLDDCCTCGYTLAPDAETCGREGCGGRRACSLNPARAAVAEAYSRRLHERGRLTPAQVVEGARYRFPAGYELFHLGVQVEAGETATCSHVDETTASFRLDRDHEGLDHWSNEVVFTFPEDAERFPRLVEFVSRGSVA